jgi:hypothetical protein
MKICRIVGPLSTESSECSLPWDPLRSNITGHPATTIDTVPVITLLLSSRMQGSMPKMLAADA